MAVRIDLTQKRLTLSVGDLLAAPLALAGRVSGVSAFTRMALGREAHAEHQRTQAASLDGYAREISIRFRATVDGFAVTVQGRIDGVIPGEPTVVEEIKSVVLAPLAFAALGPDAHPHYVEQLRLYCFFLERQEQKPTLGRLVFINVADGARKLFEYAAPFDDCETLIIERVRLLINQAAAKEQERKQRRATANDLGFPHPKPRRHQDEMIAAVEHALAEGRHLLVNAPSGIGKTAGSLFPVVKHALAHDRRVFFVTSKNTQQAVAMETLKKLTTPTAVAFRAREKMCINSVYACREEFCPFLQMMPVKLERTGALERLLEKRTVTPEMLMEAGQGTSVCPFELALTLAERTDVIVCDYNYVFDPQVYFRRFFLDEDYADAVLVIDEAHNLVQRALEYYSPTLRRRQIHELAKNLRHVEPSLARDLRKFLTALDDLFDALARRHGDEHSQLTEEEMPPARQGDKFVIETPRKHFEDLKPAFQKLTVRYLLDKATSGRAIPDDPVEEFFGAFGQFCSVLAMDGEEFSCVFDASAHEAIQIVCKDASRLLAERLEGFHSVIAMSATLAPIDFYRQMLGFREERTDTVSLPSPFPPEQRRIVVVPDVLTTFRARSAHYDKIARIITTTAQSRRGNYMALFPSYDFMRHVAEQLGDSGTGVSPVWAEGHLEQTGETPVPLQLIIQTPKMTDAQRQTLLATLTTTEPPKLVLAVQGGLFAEGVDFAGDLLIGVIVVSPSLPQVSFERELMRRYYEQRYGKGFEFAYLYPGMNRVIQSVGRLIRTETDIGVAVLVCQRFKQTQYATLFPPDWAESLTETRGPAALEAELRRFWQ